MPPEQRAIVLRRCSDWRHTVRKVLINDMPLTVAGSGSNATRRRCSISPSIGWRA
jgi:hypothetical protein